MLFVVKHCVQPNQSHHWHGQHLLSTWCILMDAEFLLAQRKSITTESFLFLPDFMHAAAYNSPQWLLLPMWLIITFKQRSRPEEKHLLNTRLESTAPYLSGMLQPPCSAALNLSPLLCLKALVSTSAPSASCPRPFLYSPHLPAIYHPQPSKVSDLPIPPSLPPLLCKTVLLWLWADFQSSHSGLLSFTDSLNPTLLSKDIALFHSFKLHGKAFSPHDTSIFTFPFYNS